MAQVALSGGRFATLGGLQLQNLPASTVRTRGMFIRTSSTNSTNSWEKGSTTHRFACLNEFVHVAQICGVLKYIHNAFDENKSVSVAPLLPSLEQATFTSETGGTEEPKAAHVSVL